MPPESEHHELTENIDNHESSEIPADGEDDNVSETDSFTSVHSLAVLNKTAQQALQSAQSSYDNFKKLLEKDSKPLLDNKPGRKQSDKSDENKTYEIIKSIIKKEKSKAKRTKGLVALGLKEN